MDIVILLRRARCFSPQQLTLRLSISSVNHLLILTRSSSGQLLLGRSPFPSLRFISHSESNPIPCSLLLRGHLRITGLCYRLGFSGKGLFLSPYDSLTGTRPLNGTGQRSLRLCCRLSYSLSSSFSRSFSGGFGSRFSGGFSSL